MLTAILLLEHYIGGGLSDGTLSDKARFVDGHCLTCLDVSIGCCIIISVPDDSRSTATAI